MERNENEEMDASETEEEVTGTSTSSQHKNSGISNTRSPRTENKGSILGNDNIGSCKRVSSLDTGDYVNPSAAAPLVSSDGKDPSALPVSNELQTLGIRLTYLEKDPSENEPQLRPLRPVVVRLAAFGRTELQANSTDKSSDQSSRSLPETPGSNSSADSRGDEIKRPQLSSRRWKFDVAEFCRKVLEADRTDKSSDESLPLPQTQNLQRDTPLNDQSNNTDESSDQSLPLPQIQNLERDGPFNDQSKNTEESSDQSSRLIRDSQWAKPWAVLNDQSNRIDNSRHQSLQALRFHMLRQLPSRSYELRLTCSTHNATFSSFAEQLNHERTHHGRRLQWPHVCLKCGAGFETDQELDDHKVTHNDDSK